MSYGTSSSVAGYGKSEEEASLLPDAASSQPEGELAEHLRRLKTIMRSPMELGGKWKPHQVARLFWSAITILSVLVGLPILVLHLAAIESEIRVYLVVISAVFCLLAIPISVYSVRRHLLHFWVPPLQIYIIRILWMVRWLLGRTE